LFPFLLFKEDLSKIGDLIVDGLKEQITKINEAVTPR